MFDRFFDGSPLLSSDMMGSTHYQKLRGIVEAAWFGRYIHWKSSPRPSIDMDAIDLDAIRAKAKRYKDNPYILFIENAQDMAVIRHPDVHAVIASDKIENRNQDSDLQYEALLALEHETEALILDKIMEEFRKTLSDEEIELLEYDPDRFEEQTGLFAEQSNMYSTALHFQERVANMQLGELSERITLDNPEDHCFVTLLDDHGKRKKYPLKTVLDEAHYLRKLFVQVTGKTAKGSNIFVHGNGIFGPKTLDNFHVDRHEISEEDRMAKAWGGMAPEPEFIMLRNYMGPPTQYVRQYKPNLTQDDLDAWEERPEDFDHDQIAKKLKSRRPARHNIILFKTTELGLGFEQAISEGHPAFVHRGPTIHPAQGRMAMAFTSLS